MPVSISVNVCRCCGCKSSEFIQLNNSFSELFSIFFISSWLGDFYNPKFFEWLWGFACFGWLGWFSHEGAKARRFVFSWFSWFILNINKAQSRGLLHLLFAKRRSIFFFAFCFCFLLMFLLKTTVLAPMGRKILLLFSLKSKRLEGQREIAPDLY